MGIRGRPATRFAPSPTGFLHAGHAYSVLLCQQWAERHQAACWLRIEDIDAHRCREAFVDAIIEDLAWLGVRFDRPHRRQSEHLGEYTAALKRLQALGVLYPCFCTRKRIAEEIARMGSAPHGNEPMPAYSGRCRRLGLHQRRRRMRHERFAWRLDVAAALQLVGPDLSWVDDRGRHHPVRVPGDVIIGRKDIGISYHLAVVVDDAIQSITHVIRGEDLLPSTSVHRLLQALLQLPSPVYQHHRLLRDAQGRRLAKRTGAPSLRSLRDAGVAPQRLRRYLLEECDGIWRQESWLPATRRPS